MERESLTAELDVAASEPSSFMVKIRRRLSDFARSVNLKYVRLGLLSGGLPSPSSWLPLALAPPLLAAAAAYWLASVVDRRRLFSPDHHLLTSFAAAWLGAAALLLATHYLKRPRPVYLVEFACYRPGDEHAISKAGFLDMTARTGFFDAEALGFQARVTARSGLGDRTYLPPGIQARPPRLRMAEARAEAEAVMFGCLDALFAATGVDLRRDVGVLVVNCSLFNPTPSLASMVVNRYKMREDVKSLWDN